MDNPDKEEKLRQKVKAGQPMKDPELQMLMEEEWVILNKWLKEKDAILKKEENMVGGGPVMNASRLKDAIKESRDDNFFEFAGGSDKKLAINHHNLDLASELASRAHQFAGELEACYRIAKQKAWEHYSDKVPPTAADEYADNASARFRAEWARASALVKKYEGMKSSVHNRIITIRLRKETAHYDRLGKKDLQ